MNGSILDARTITVGKRRVTLLSQSGAGCDTERCAPCVVCLHETGDALSPLLDALNGVCAAYPQTVFVIPAVDWNAELSPWPVPKVFRGGEDFAGQAPAYLGELTERVLPAAEAAFGIDPAAPRTRVLAGYSLAGLFAAWAGLETDVFSRVVSASGSLWYDGFEAYARARLADVRAVKGGFCPARVYFSLGDREPLTRNARMASVGVRTRAMCGLFSDAGCRTTFVSEPGGHFDDPAARLARGIGWVLADG